MKKKEGKLQFEIAVQYFSKMLEPLMYTLSEKWWLIDIDLLLYEVIQPEFIKKGTRSRYKFQSDDMLEIKKD